MKLGKELGILYING